MSSETGAIPPHDADQRDEESSPHSPARRTGTRRRRLGFAIVVAGVVAGSGWMALRWVQVSHIPVVALDGVTSNVAEDIRAARLAVEQQPWSGSKWGRLGMVLQAYEYKLEAGACYREASRLDARDVHWPYYLGSLQFAEDKQGALASFREAVARRPDLPMVRTRLAELLLELGHWADAERELRLAADQVETSGRTAYRLAQALFQQHRDDESLPWAQRAREQRPKSGAVNALLARIHARLGNHSAAEEHLRSAQQQPVSDSEWPDALLLEVALLRRDPYWLARLARQLQDQGDMRAATRLLVQAVEQQPADWTLRQQLALAHVSANQVDAATNVLDAGLQQIPDSFELQKLRGAVDMLRGRWENAAQRLSNALRLKPDDSAAHCDLGHCLRELGHSDRAEQEFRTAIRCQPDSVKARLELAETLSSQGRDEEAERLGREVLKIEPHNSTAQRLTRGSFKANPEGS